MGGGAVFRADDLVAKDFRGALPADGKIVSYSAISVGWKNKENLK